MTQFLTGILNGVVIVLLGACFGMGFAISYNYFNNKTKKVCDLCFRDIKKVNEYYNKNNKTP